jgi:hypothetical protein
MICGSPFYYKHRSGREVKQAGKVFKLRIRREKHLKTLGFRCLLKETSKMLQTKDSEEGKTRAVE